MSPVEKLAKSNSKSFQHNTYLNCNRNEISSFGGAPWRLQFTFFPGGRNYCWRLAACSQCCTPTEIIYYNQEEIYQGLLCARNKESFFQNERPDSLLDFTTTKTNGSSFFTLLT
jgi:hypothetical protein